MKPSLKLFCVTVLTLAVAGCGQKVVRDRSNDYLRAEEVAPMSVPEDQSSAAIGELYDIPVIADTAGAPQRFKLPRPQPLSENLFEDIVKIESFGDKRWIAINKPPAEVWPRIRNILSRSQVPTTRVDATAGEIETAWLEFKDDDENAHRFRFTIRPGVGVNSTEVSILEMAAPLGKEAESSEWPQTSMSDAREQEFLQITSDALDNEINSGSVSLLAQNIGGEDRVQVIADEDIDPYLQIKLGYERAWNSVINSLSKGGFTVLDQDRSAGRVSVEFKEIIPVDEGGTTLMEIVLNFGKKDVETPPVKYQVTLSENQQAIEVRVLDDARNQLDRPSAMKLLKVIRGNLS
ncbi:MAG: outer membrane protein assembly factor BamC [Gammaproteobacteria bacterium]|nr:MAG: outer membrane protein assembly factor BamC [Gammaproteobacteria bacterium]